MKSGITEIIYYIEKNFYKGNTLFLEEKELCNAEKQLPCNCLTGIILNYWAFTYYNCYKSNLEPSFRIYNKNEPCVFCSYNNKELLPVVSDEPNMNNWDDYILNGFICEEEYVSDDQIYIKKIYDEFPKPAELKDYEPEKKITEAKPMFEFLSYYYPMTRTCTIEKESSLLLFMTLYLFPNNTIKLIFAYLDQNASEEEKGFIKDFLSKYELFINEVTGNEYGFITRFSLCFQKYMNIPIAECIEKVDKNENNNFCHEILIAAYNRNVEELKRSRSLFKKIKNL